MLKYIFIENLSMFKLKLKIYPKYFEILNKNYSILRPFC